MKIRVDISSVLLVLSIITLQAFAFFPNTNLVTKTAFTQIHANTPKTTTTLFEATTAAEAISTLAKSQDTAVNDIIASAIPDLTPKPELSWSSSSSKEIGGKSATLDARDAPGPSNVAWLANLCISETISSLTIFNGPLSSIPHLLSRCLVVSPDKMQLDLDFRPRAYGAYEMKDDAGNYPGPETLGREAFTYSGNRKEYEKHFGTEEVSLFLLELTKSLDGVETIEDSSNEFDVLTRGPLAISVVFSITTSNIELVAKARTKAVEYWLSWAKSDEFDHRPGAPINSQYVYDSKYRQNAYSGLLKVYTDALGQSDGAALAAAESGPLDEAYVGGGS